eukprot:gene27473-33177_t
MNSFSGAFCVLFLAFLLLFLTHPASSADQLRPHHNQDFYFNSTCSQADYFLADLQALRHSSSLRGGGESIRVGFGLISATSSSAPSSAEYLRTLRVVPGSSPLQICLRSRSGAGPLTFFFTPLQASQFVVLQVCHTQLLHLRAAAAEDNGVARREVVVALSEGPGSADCRSSVLHDAALVGRVRASLVHALEDPPCTNQPTSTPTSLPTLAALNPSNNGSSASLFETTTFISSVTAAGGAGVMTAASASYYVLRNARNFVKVPMAPDDLAMAI